MRFNSRNRSSQMPEVNLVPMMDVIMTILTFFIIVSMTLTSQKSVNVTLPSASDGVQEFIEPDPLLVELTLQGKTQIEGKPVGEDELAQQIREYLQKNPRGAVILNADRKVPYEQVAKTLGTLRDMGGERVSLAIDN